VRLVAHMYKLTREPHSLIMPRRDIMHADTEASTKCCPDVLHAVLHTCYSSSTDNAAFQPVTVVTIFHELRMQLSRRDIRNLNLTAFSNVAATLLPQTRITAAAYSEATVQS
jgi:hypothetical protein